MRRPLGGFKLPRVYNLHAYRTQSHTLKVSRQTSHTLHGKQLELISLRHIESRPNITRSPYCSGIAVWVRWGVYAASRVLSCLYVDLVWF